MCTVHLILQLLQPSSFAPALVAVGAFIIVFSKKSNTKHAASIVVAHSHTNGISLPTKKDTDMIKRLKSSLKAIGVMLADFFIIADMQYTAISTLEDFEDLLF